MLFWLFLFYNKHSTTLNPYPPHYKAAFASFCIPHPLTFRRASQQASSLPEEINGLTLFRALTLTSDLDAIFLPRVQMLAWAILEHPTKTLYFLVQAYQPL